VDIMDTLIAVIALVVSSFSLLISIYIFLRSFRPIVTIAVKTHSGDETKIRYDFVVRNSGARPARNIRIKADESALASAFGREASDWTKERWLACFNLVIPFLQNDDHTSCSFGYTRKGDAGFWKYRATIPVRISYEGWVAKKYERWFGNKYEEPHTIWITDSDSFTGYYWGDGEVPFQRE